MIEPGDTILSDDIREQGAAMDGPYVISRRNSVLAGSGKLIYERTYTMNGSIRRLPVTSRYVS